MIIGKDANRDLMRHGECVVTVEKDPPAAGSTFWVRPSAMSDPSCEVVVTHSWQHADGHDVLLARVKPGFKVPRKRSEKREFRLTRAQRTRIFAGDGSPLLFEEEPKCKKGDKVFLSWSRPKRVYDKTTRRVTDPPREPLVWIEILGKARRPATEGGWEVRIRIEDHRPNRTRLLRRTPPVLDPEVRKRDLDRPPDAEEIAKARLESSYTTSPRDAIDHLEGSSDEELEQFAKEAERGAAQTATLQQARRERHGLELRLARLRRDAAVRGVDISSPERVIERQIKKMEQRVYQGKLDDEEAA